MPGVRGGDRFCPPAGDAAHPKGCLIWKAAHPKGCLIWKAAHPQRMPNLGARAGGPWALTKPLSRVVTQSLFEAKGLGIPTIRRFVVFWDPQNMEGGLSQRLRSRALTKLVARWLTDEADGWADDWRPGEG